MVVRVYRTLAGLLILILAACGASSASGGPTALPTSVPNLQPPPQAVLAASTQVVGPNRLPIGILVDGTPINDPAAQLHLRFYYLDDPARQDTLAGETSAEYFGQGLPFGVYVAFPNFPLPGTWRVDVEIKRPNQPTSTSKLVLTVLAEDPTPAIGSPALSVETPTASAEAELKQISSAATPDPALYAVSLDAALKQGRPIGILFATPGFCKTATCGPNIDVLEGLQQRYGERMTFIHVETYAYPFAESAAMSPPRLAPAMLAWGLKSEPWLFLIDKNGLIRYKYEGGITTAELDPVITDLLSQP